MKNKDYPIPAYSLSSPSKQKLTYWFLRSSRHFCKCTSPAAMRTSSPVCCTSTSTLGSAWFKSFIPRTSAFMSPTIEVCHCFIFLIDGGCGLYIIHFLYVVDIFYTGMPWFHRHSDNRCCFKAHIREGWTRYRVCDRSRFQNVVFKSSNT